MRILGLDGVVELREPSVVTAGAVEPVFVADFDVVQLERLGMAVLDALRAPFGGGVAGDVFNFIERVLNVRFELRSGGNVIMFQRVTGEHGEHRFHVQVLAPAEKFRQAETVGGPVIPATAMAGPLLDGADGFLPVETLVEVIAFDVIAAGEAQKFRMHVREQLRDVGTVAIRAIVVGRREQRNLLKPDRGFLAPKFRPK